MALTTTVIMPIMQLHVLTPFFDLIPATKQEQLGSHAAGVLLLQVQDFRQTVLLVICYLDLVYATLCT